MKPDGHIKINFLCGIRLQRALEYKHFQLSKAVPRIMKLRTLAKNI